MIQSQFPHSTILRGNGNWWWAGSLQKGLKQLQRQSIDDDDVVIFINDDSRMSPDFIAKGVAILSNSPGSLIQSTIRCADTGEVVDRGYVFERISLSFRPVQQDESPNCLTTNGLFVRWIDLKRIGGFWPRLLPHYLSDYEFTLRAGKRGLKLIVSSELELTWQRKTTGYRQIEAVTNREFLGKLFSPRYPSNPVYTTAFAFLTCPIPLAFRHSLRIWRTAADTWVIWRRKRIQTGNI